MSGLSKISLDDWSNQAYQKPMKHESPTIDTRDHILQTAQMIMSGKGFSGVGLNEVLATAAVPKGSFYHYFSSKEVFGEELLKRYFRNYLAAMDETFSLPGLTGAGRLMRYWQHWLATQTAEDPQSKCLVVKLAAEVADLSEAMRGVLVVGTTQIIGRLSDAIAAGQGDGSLSVQGDPSELAAHYYRLWLGASLMAKITKDDAPLRAAMKTTLQELT